MKTTGSVAIALVSLFMLAPAGCRAPRPADPVAGDRRPSPPQPPSEPPAPAVQIRFETAADRPDLPATLPPTVQVTPVAVSLDPGFTAMEMRGPDGMVSYRKMRMSGQPSAGTAVDESAARELAAAWVAERLPRLKASLAFDKIAPFHRRAAGEDKQQSAQPAGYVARYTHQVNGVNVGEDFVVVRMTAEGVDGCQVRLSEVQDKSPPATPKAYLPARQALQRAVPKLLEYFDDTLQQITVLEAALVYWHMPEHSASRQVGQPYDAMLTHRLLIRAQDRELWVLIDAFDGDVLHTFSSGPPTRGA